MGYKPKALEDKLELFPDIEFAHDTFWILAGSRRQGMPIPVSEMIKYWNEYKILELDEFIRYVQAADIAYLESREEK